MQWSNSFIHRDPIFSVSNLVDSKFSDHFLGMGPGPFRLGKLLLFGKNYEKHHSQKAHQIGNFPFLIGGKGTFLQLGMGPFNGPDYR